MSTLRNWASMVGFRDLGGDTYRGQIHSSHLESVCNTLTEMGLTCAFSNPNFQIWSTEDDNEIVLINHNN